MNMTSRGFSLLIIVIAVAVLALTAGGYVSFVKDSTPEFSNTDNSTPETKKERSSESTTFKKLEIGDSILDDKSRLMGYERDSQGVYLLFANGPSQRKKTLTQADATTFEVSQEWSIYARDKDNVYVEGVVIPNADPATFVPLCGYPTPLESFCAYGKDARNVYAYTEIIPNADPATFTSLASGGKTWTTTAVDKSAYYTDYVPGVYGDFSNIAGVRVTTLSDGSPLKFPNPHAITAVNPNGASWGGYYEGVPINGKVYYGGTYFTDGTNVWTEYSACDVDSSGKESNCSSSPLISQVEKVGARPDGL